MGKEENPKALLPIAAFLVIYIGGGIFYHDFYKMPAIVVFLIGLAIAMVQTRHLSFNDRISVMAKDLGDDNIITMCLVFLAAGAFTGAVTAAGGVDSTVNLGLTLLPASFAIIGLFLIGCFISLSMGTSVGTIAALAPIAVGISEKTGFAMALCIGAVVSGAMFGDNLSMISDTTIAATKTQGCEMKDKFEMNFKIVIIPAILTVVLLFLFTMKGAAYSQADLSYNVFQVIPYLVVLAGALLGFNVFGVLISGIILSIIVGVSTGTMAIDTIFTSIGGGISAMYDITVISIVVCCISALVKENGGIDAILGFVRRRVHSKKGAELGIGLISAGVDLATANNTVAIIVTGDIAKNISEEYGIEPKVSASILDIFTSTIQGILPYGAQLLYAAAATTGSTVVLSAFNIIPYVFYPLLMGLAGILYIFVGSRFIKTSTDKTIK